MRSVELFAGAGGLALGCELAGFEPAAVVEWDRWACDTVRENRATGHPLVQGWEVMEGDVRAVDWSGVRDVDLVAGGPPCQPFSMGGKSRAHDDQRDMFPATAEVIATLRPKAFLIENVKGLTRSAFANYFQYILLRMEMPEMIARDGESWFEHLQRLQAEHTGEYDGLKYKVASTVVNAADYGVPQQRHRVFIVGFRDDMKADWKFPSATHSYDALLYDQWVTGAYWDRHQIPTSKRPDPPARSARKIAELKTAERSTLLMPWRTVRDAIADLPEPGANGTRGYLNHRHQPGARSYAGHTGSPLDMPSKALKAGGHGVPGGENMLVRLDGSLRYYSIREAARIQTFPDRYELHGAWGEAMRQLGNAVPVLLAEKVASSVAEHIVLAEGHKIAANVRRDAERVA
ncbi:DNA cytosine methyltransferase [Isoptericola sediminis]|uniref:DNA (cytosine-5-)-methyltransferase n=1 Tax=Isoptericola sediminis TaxID=2733572 RepID=A0A849JTR6_9MICO|nr:DNA cytosine methyltransferase [Isoptericola sediminis]NNU26786.1 DNA (cytosine-5-)-methyltransferase [Isoptericola sediminis]